MNRLALLLAAAVALAGSAAPLAAQSAEDWPNRPVRVISTFAAGGTADILARILADHFSTVFKQQFYVEVRAGASGTIGVKAAIDSPPDGYNLVVSNISQLVLLPISNPNLGFDPRKDLTNISYIAGSPVLVSVNAKGDIKTLKDFIERGRGGKVLTYSSSGVGSMGHLVGEMIGQKTGARVEHVPYKGASQGLNDLVGGHIVWASQTVTSTATHLSSGTLLGIAVTSDQRLEAYPDIPTFKESGYPDVVGTIWFALSGPAGLPPAIAQRLNAEVTNALRKPEVAARLRNEGSIVQTLTPAQFQKFVEDETTRWRPVLQSTGQIEKK